MQKLQPFSAKLGEINFRKKLVAQHLGKKNYFPTQPNASEILKILKLRAKQSLKIFKQLQSQGVALSSFLEIGAEKCERSAILTSKFNAKGIAVDLSSASLKSASYFCPKLGLNKLPKRIVADAYHLPFKNNSFKFIFTFQTLHHFPDPLPIIKEVYRVLTPGGYFYFAEEPIKQLINFPFWRRDYHLRWWEKLLKYLGILPFISQIGRSEVKAGILENTFNLQTWEKALSSFNKVEVNLIPYPVGPVTNITKTSQAGWLKPKITTKLLLYLLGGGISALCQKK